MSDLCRVGIICRQKYEKLFTTIFKEKAGKVESLKDPNIVEMAFDHVSMEITVSLIFLIEQNPEVSFALWLWPYNIDLPETLSLIHEGKITKITSRKSTPIVGVEFSDEGNVIITESEKQKAETYFKVREEMEKKWDRLSSRPHLTIVKN